MVLKSRDTSDSYFCSLAMIFVPELAYLCRMNHLLWVLATLVAGVLSYDAEFTVKTNSTFCSFFNNRAPSPQPGLRNCTWFRGNSCCKQEEIDATFGTVKPLPGSSPECQRYTNYLMCYVCAPYQNIFYSQEKLTVCEEFCNRWYAACSDAILKGSVIGELYTSGREFCLKRNFQCEPYINGSCFIYDPSLTRRPRSNRSPEGLSSTGSRFLVSICKPINLFVLALSLMQVVFTAYG